MDVREAWHRLSHWHTSIPKDDIDATIYVCAPRIWWKPWCVNADHIDVTIIKDADVLKARTLLNWKQFQDFITMTNLHDMYALIAKGGK